MQPGSVPTQDQVRALWSAGDFGQIARFSRKEAEGFVGRIGVEPGSAVLDVACGTGNLAIPAARAGARVTGLDIAPNLLEQARKRAAEEGLEIAFDEGNAEELPYRDGQFDLVISMFGAMFAPRPERVAAELIRVCRPGGRIAMANWTAQGFAARMFGLGARFVPPPAGVPSPLLWGDDATAKQRLAQGTSSIATTVRQMNMEFPFPPVDVVRLFRTYFGPVQTTFARLDPPKQAEYAAALEELWSAHNDAPEGRTRAQGEYLEVIATRA